MHQVHISSGGLFILTSGVTFLRHNQELKIAIGDLELAISVKNLEAINPEWKVIPESPVKGMRGAIVQLCGFSNIKEVTMDPLVLGVIEGKEIILNLNSRMGIHPGGIVLLYQLGLRHVG